MPATKPSITSAKRLLRTTSLGQLGHVIQPHQARAKVSVVNSAAPSVARQVAAHTSPKPEFHSLAHSQNFAILVLRKPYLTTTFPLVADDKGNSAPTPTTSEGCDTDY